jgi:glycosyltransferase involved in cell wall biosynthesis
MTATRISVIVPSYNYGRFLNDALDSVVAQVRPADEIVLVNDGSSDETDTVMRQFADSHAGTVMLSRTTNRGTVASFNDGVEASSGSVVVILSADDTMSPNYLADLESALTSGGYGFAYAQMKLFGAFDSVFPARPYDPQFLARANYVNASSMFCRALFDDVGGFNPKFDRSHEDWAFWLAARNRGWLGIGVNSCWLNYRQHNGGKHDSVTRGDRLRLFWDLRQAELATTNECLDGVARMVIGDSRRGLGNLLRRRFHGRLASTPGID